ncbi:MAG: energy transducer TonB, partial [Flavobacteriia bacterium]|nr:energy transducer TonB [Flavobacteriia bacterium]
TCRQDTSFHGCKVFLMFVVNENGAISGIKVLKGCKNCPDADREAVRLVSSMPAWKPAKMQGSNVKSYYNLPVSFKIQ